MMRGKRVLDLCCGGGGAARGYLDAGADFVWGVDSDWDMREDFLRTTGRDGVFHHADALEILANTEFVAQFDFIHISPPCQRWSRMANCRPGLAAKYPDLITPSLPLLRASGKPWLLENIDAPGTRALLPGAAVYCGVMFGREMYRHRLMLAGGWELKAPIKPAFQIVPERDGIRIVKPNSRCGWPHAVRAERAGHWKPGSYVSVSGHERRGPVNDAMGIHWMKDREHVKEAIPPCFTEHIGRQFAEAAPD